MDLAHLHFAHYLFTVFQWPKQKWARAMITKSLRSKRSTQSATHLRRATTERLAVKTRRAHRIRWKVEHEWIHYRCEGAKATELWRQDRKLMCLSSTPVGRSEWCETKITVSTELNDMCILMFLVSQWRRESMMIKSAMNANIGCHGRVSSHANTKQCTHEWINIEQTSDRP